MSDKTVLKMKTQTYGTSSWRGVPAPKNKGQRCHKVNSPLSHNPHITKAREQAFADYLEKRSNGTSRDNPERSFPRDGRFAWTNPVEYEYSAIAYMQGPEDAKWMAEKDIKYLARREFEQLERVTATLEKQEENGDASLHGKTPSLQLAKNEGVALPSAIQPILHAFSAQAPQQQVLPEGHDSGQPDPKVARCIM